MNALFSSRLYCRAHRGMGFTTQTDVTAKLIRSKRQRHIAWLLNKTCFFFIIHS